MWIFGVNPVSEALEAAPSRIHRIAVTRGRSSTRLQSVVDLARRHGIPLSFEPAEALARKAGTTHHQNVIAETAEIGFADLEAVLAGKPSPLLLADGVEDPRNLGALLRTAEAAGVAAVLLPERHSCGLTPLVVQASAGGALHLKIARIGNVAGTLERLKKGGYWSVGLDMNGTSNPAEIDSSLPLVIVVGGENRGLRRLVRERCDFLVALPMKGRVSSLNLSVAAGILLYQLMPR